MAIKGKKKSGQRGSQARRRPAAAPRAALTAKTKTHWYETAAGRVIAAILVVLVIAGIGGLFAINRSNASKEEKRREAVEDYVGELRSILQTASPVATEMAAVPLTPGDATNKQIEDGAKGWIEQLQKASTRATAVIPPESVSKISPIFPRSLQTYLTTARLFESIPKLEGPAAADVLTRAIEYRTNADADWATAVQLIDEVLADLGGDPSGLSSPAAGAPPPAPAPPETPAPEETTAPEPEETGGGGKGKKNKDDN